MKKITLFFSILSFLSCSENQVRLQLSVIPEISVTDFEFKDGGLMDTVVLTFKYQDGDANLGFDYSEDKPNPWIYLKDNNNQFILLGSSDTLPGYDCFNWKTGEAIEYWEGYDIENLATSDTVLVEPNPKFFNFEIDFYTVIDNTRSQIDLTQNCYPGFDMRLYDFNKMSENPAIIEYFPKSEFQGEVVCKFISMGWTFIADNKPIIANFLIKDNDDNHSNIAETEEILIP